ncbi:MAG: RluA family pseudouridine synthase [Bacilli bacterium]|nr:RluA family pseudouridine synthase [Bacilli bacterium]
MIVEEMEGNRIDKWISLKLDLSRAKVQKLINDEKVLVNDKVVSASYKVKLGDKVVVNDELDYTTSVEAEDIPLDIVYEDQYLMIINKESGMVTHPAPGNYSHTLVNALLYKMGEKVSSDLRPGIVHRLDKDTSGLMVVAKDDKTLELLSNMMKEHKVKRTYVALVKGVITEASGTVDAPIGRDPNNRQKQAVTDKNAKEAITHFKVLKRFNNATLIECELETGRTHQIRVHMAYIKHPVLNDPTYNKDKASSFGQMLHSKKIEFTHPVTKKKLKFESELPKEFNDKIEELENEE